jgi:hypothetical protein
MGGKKRIGTREVVAITVGVVVVAVLLCITFTPEPITPIPPIPQAIVLSLSPALYDNGVNDFLIITHVGGENVYKEDLTLRVKVENGDVVVVGLGTGVFSTGEKTDNIRVATGMNSFDVDEFYRVSIVHEPSETVIYDADVRVRSSPNA